MGLPAAVKAIEEHDVAGLRAAIDGEPAVLALPVGRNRNHLLDMAVATCDERTVALLLEHGADVAAANVHGWTALHQAAYVGLPALAELLLAAGAPTATSARGAGGTPLVVALFWGHRATAEVLAARELTPVNLRVAAGLDRLRLAAELLDGGTAGAARAFHRPHSGFPDWMPTDDPQEVLDEALTWAARNDAVEALTLLAARGARLDADPHRGTALAWAAFVGRVAAIERLLALGAEADGRSSFGGPDHGEGVTPLHLAAQRGHLPAITALLAAGADTAATDALHAATPRDWARHAGQDAAAALLA